MLYNYKHNIKKKYFEFVTERNICDGKENDRDGKDILVYNNNYQYKSKPPLTVLNNSSDAK